MSPSEEDQSLPKGTLRASHQEHSEAVDSSGESAGGPNATPSEQLAANDLFATIRDGTANLESVKLLIDGFEILAELGRGAFGVVYRARDEKLDRQVAIKISLIDDPRRREQYIKEAKNAAKLDHPGIVPVYQVGILPGGQPFVVQRLIAGGTLRQVLTDVGVLDIHHACWLMKEIAAAVAKAHAAGMIHRDLKPDNILIDQEGNPWVADFGLAILEEDQGKHRGEKAGTPLYMSPEQLRGRSEWLDGRADIYALGIMLYEMLVGRTPYDASTLAELEEQVLHRDPKPISQRSPKIPTVMDTIFQNCCAKQVNDRYLNAFEFVADLDYVLAEFPNTEGVVAASNLVFGSSASKRKSTKQFGVSTRRKTLRSTIRNDTPLPQRRHVRRLVLVLGLLGAVLLVAALLSLKLIEPKPASKALENDLIGRSAIEQQLPITPEIPGRPFRVSKGSDGTHTSIAAAVVMSDEHEVITVAPGNYVESLTLTQHVKLIGEGARGDVVIVGQDAPALTVVDGISVDLDNLTLEGNSTNEVEFNTIHVQNGSLNVESCNIYSRSYDCVKIEPGCALTAHRCNFRSTAHPALSATAAVKVQVDDCNFEIAPQTLETKSIPVGIQASNCEGTIRNCTFHGSGDAIGIHWKDSSSLITIADSDFEGCGIGLLLQDCTLVQIVANETTTLKGCVRGILLERCQGTLQNAEISGTLGQTGIRVIGNDVVSAEPQIAINNVRINGYDCALSVEHENATVNGLQCSYSQRAGVQVVSQAEIKMTDSSVSDNSLIGIVIEDSTAMFQNCEFRNNQYAGMSVDAEGKAVDCIDCTFESNLSGVLLSAGTIALQSTQFHTNSVGVLVISRSQLNGQPIPDDEQTHIDLVLKDVDIRDNENVGMVIRTPCRYRFLGGNFLDPINDNTPKISNDLRLERDGDVNIVLRE